MYAPNNLQQQCIFQEGLIPMELDFITVVILWLEEWLQKNAFFLLVSFYVYALK